MVHLVRMPCNDLQLVTLQQRAPAEKKCYEYIYIYISESHDHLGVKVMLAPSNV